MIDSCSYAAFISNICEKNSSCRVFLIYKSTNHDFSFGFIIDFFEAHKIILFFYFIFGMFCFYIVLNFFSCLPFGLKGNVFFSIRDFVIFHYVLYFTICLSFRTILFLGNICCWMWIFY